MENEKNILDEIKENWGTYKNGFIDIMKNSSKFPLEKERDYTMELREGDGEFVLDIFTEGDVNFKVFTICEDKDKISFRNNKKKNSIRPYYKLRSGTTKSLDKSSPKNYIDILKDAKNLDLEKFDGNANEANFEELKEHAERFYLDTDIRYDIKDYVDEKIEEIRSQIGGRGPRIFG